MSWICFWISKCCSKLQTIICVRICNIDGIVWERWNWSLGSFVFFYNSGYGSTTNLHIYTRQSCNKFYRVYVFNRGSVQDARRNQVSIVDQKFPRFSASNRKHARPQTADWSLQTTQSRWTSSLSAVSNVDSTVSQTRANVKKKLILNKTFVFTFSK